MRVELLRLDGAIGARSVALLGTQLQVTLEVIDKHCPLAQRRNGAPRLLELGVASLGLPLRSLQVSVEHILLLVHLGESVLEQANLLGRARVRRLDPLCLAP